MRMSFVFIMIISISLLAGCISSNEKGEKSIDRIYSKEELQSIRNLLKSFPENYSADDAINDGLFVIAENHIVGGEDKWNAFKANVNDVENDSIIVATIAKTGDMRLMYLSYMENEFFSYFDLTRVSFSSVDYYSSKQYKYLKDYKIEDESSIVLVNDALLTYGDIKHGIEDAEATGCHLFTIKIENGNEPLLTLVPYTNLEKTFEIMIPLTMRNSEYFEVRQTIDKYDRAVSYEFLDGDSINDIYIGGIIFEIIIATVDARDIPGELITVEADSSYYFNPVTEPIEQPRFSEKVEYYSKYLDEIVESFVVLE